MHVAYYREYHDPVVKAFIANFIMIELIVICLFHKGNYKNQVDDKVHN